MTRGLGAWSFEVKCSEGKIRVESKPELQDNSVGQSFHVPSLLPRSKFHRMVCLLDYGDVGNLNPQK